MHFLLLFFEAILVLYLAIWAILLVLCFRKNAFWPVIGDSKTTKKFWLATFILMNPVLTALYFFFGQIRSPKVKPNAYAFSTVLAFAIVGFYFNFPGITHLWMQPFLGRSKNIPRFHASIAAIKSGNNTNTSSVSNSSNNSKLACKNVAVFCEDSDVLICRIGNDLKEFIKKIPNIETVDYYNSDSHPPQNAISPDIFIRLNLDNIKENFLPYILKLQADIHVLISNHSVSGGSGYYDNRTPPIFNYSLNMELSHKSETTGYESIRYDMASKDIAKQISKELEKNIKTWREKYGLLPDIPAGFYGEYKPNELPEPFESFEIKKLYSYSGLMKHNETAWQTDVSGDAVGKLGKLQDQLVELGWKKLSGDLDERFLEMRLEKDNRRLHIFKQRESDSFRPGVFVTTTQKVEKAKPTRLNISDVESLNDEELYSALDKLLEEPVNMELVMLFERMFNSPEQDKFFELLRSKPLTSLNDQIRLAEMYDGRKMQEEAKQTFFRAKALFWIMPEESDLRSRLQQLAKKFGDEKLVQEAPSRDLLLDMGCTEITKETQPFVKHTAPDEQVIVFSQKEDGTIKTLCLSCTPLDKSNPSFVLHSAEHGANSGKSWGTQNSNSSKNNSDAFHFVPDFLDDFTLDCRVTKNNNSDKYLMSFELQKQAGR